MFVDTCELLGWEVPTDARSAFTVWMKIQTFYTIIRTTQLMGRLCKTGDIGSLEADEWEKGMGADWEAKTHIQMNHVWAEAHAGKWLRSMTATLAWGTVETLREMAVDAWEEEVVAELGQAKVWETEIGIKEGVSLTRSIARALGQALQPSQARGAASMLGSKRIMAGPDILQINAETMAVLSVLTANMANNEVFSSGASSSITAEDAEGWASGGESPITVISLIEEEAYGNARRRPCKAAADDEGALTRRREDDQEQVPNTMVNSCGANKANCVNVAPMDTFASRHAYAARPHNGTNLPVVTGERASLEPAHNNAGSDALTLERARAAVS
jgi:hypothetical protein